MASGFPTHVPGPQTEQPPLGTAGQEEVGANTGGDTGDPKKMGANVTGAPADGAVSPNRQPQSLSTSGGRKGHWSSGMPPLAPSRSNSSQK